MRRRALLRALALAPLAACAPTRRDGAAPTSPPTPATVAPTTPSPPPTVPAQPPPSPPLAPSPTVAPATVPVICRDAWGARPPRDGATAHTIRQITVHHSAAVADGADSGPRNLRAYQAFHMDDRGWPDIAYHVAVDRAGYVYALRSHDRAGDTATDYDPSGHFLLLLDGNFDTQEPTGEQLETAAHVLAWAAVQFAVDPAAISGHRDHAATSCPGDALYRQLPAVTQRTITLLEAGGVALVEFCGPEAAAAVAAIEADQRPSLLPS